MKSNTIITNQCVLSNCCLCFEHCTYMTFLMVALLNNYLIKFPETYQ